MRISLRGTPRRKVLKEGKIGPASLRGTENRKNVHRIKDISEDKFQLKVVDAETFSDPCEETIDDIDKSQNSQDVGQDLSGDDETERSTTAESVESVSRGSTFLFCSTIDDN